MDYLTALAIIPGLFMLVYIYRQDKIEKEPKGLIFKLLILGALSCLPAIAAELFWTDILNQYTGIDPYLYMLIDNFLIVALAEEFFKRMLLKFGCWKHKAFDYTFDGVIYAVSVSLGFAIAENIMYVIDGGLEVAILRALTAIPAHFVFGIYMGYYYGLSKLCYARGFTDAYNRCRIKSLIVPVLLHGAYDFVCSLDQWWSLIIYLVFIIVLDIIAIRKIKHMSKTDQAIN